MTIRYFFFTIADTGEQKNINFPNVAEVMANIGIRFERTSRCMYILPILQKYRNEC